MATLMQRRLGTTVVLEEVAWASPFRMHRRIAPRLADERRFLLGDAGHLSSPFGGEGMNSGMHDACNLGWKLALAVRGRAAPGLIESFAVERLAADRHVLEVSDKLHALVQAAVQAARTGIPAPPPPPDEEAALVRSRCMLDASYAQSPLVGEYVAGGGQPPAHPAAGTRYPDGTTLTDTSHHVLLFGDADGAAVARLGCANPE
ncbi:MAG: FAD-dependent monooxygenase [Solirubrobacteraceae bacterium]